MVVSNGMVVGGA